MCKNEHTKGPRVQDALHLEPCLLYDIGGSGRSGSEQLLFCVFQALQWGRGF